MKAKPEEEIRNVMETDNRQKANKSEDYCNKFTKPNIGELKKIT